jgi:hypothetical protein
VTFYVYVPTFLVRLWRRLTGTCIACGRDAVVEYSTKNTVCSMCGAKQ